MPALKALSIFTLALSLIACGDISPEPEASSKKIINSLPSDPRAPKAPGCQTLLQMGHMQDLKNMNISGDTLEQTYADYVDSVPTELETMKAENKTLINSCWLHLIHFKDLPNQNNGKRQLVINILAAGKEADSIVNAVGMKYTCWVDNPEIWKTDEACE